MSDSRIKNSKRNLKSAIILQIINIILPFVVRTLILYKLGEEYQGLNGLFTSILQVLNLTDLGFSSAVVYILYKPIAIGDNDTVCALISYLKRVYRIIGIVILAIDFIFLIIITPRIIQDYLSGTIRILSRHTHTIISHSKPFSIFYHIHN